MRLPRDGRCELTLPVKCAIQEVYTSQLSELTVLIRNAGHFCIIPT